MTHPQDPSARPFLTPDEKEGAALLDAVRPAIEKRILEAVAHGPEWCFLVVDKKLVLTKEYVPQRDHIVSLMPISEVKERIRVNPSLCSIDFDAITAQSLGRANNEIGIFLMGPMGAFFVLIKHVVPTHGPRLIVVVGLDSERVASVVARLAADETRVPLIFPEAGFHPSRHWDRASSLVMSRQRAVIGTHSEPLIATIGRCVDASEIASADVQIIMVDKNVDVPVRSFFFDEFGSIQGWPANFFEPTNFFAPDNRETT